MFEDTTPPTETGTHPQTLGDTTTPTETHTHPQTLGDTDIPTETATTNVTTNYIQTSATTTFIAIVSSLSCFLSLTSLFPFSNNSPSQPPHFSLQNTVGPRYNGNG